MKYKSKFKRIRAQAGISYILEPQSELLPNAQPNYNWMTFPGEIPVNPNVGNPGFEIDNSGNPIDKERIVPLERDTNGNVFTTQTKTVKVGTGRFKENPYVEAFNIAASKVTGIANMIQNNRLKKQERRQILHSLEPRYWQNMEAEGLNNIPMYTQYGGFGPNMDEPGFAHSAFYGDNTVYKYGGMPKYAAGGMTNVYGLPDELKYFADVEAEAGEVIERQNGGIVKVADDGNTHEQGGEMIPSVRRVLEDTGDKRKDLASKILKVKPEVIQEVFGFKPKTAVTHAKAYELITAELKKTHQLYTDSRKNSNMKPQMDKTAINTLRLNEMFQGQLPTEQEVFELLFNHQEGVKAQAGINDDGSMKKCGGKNKAQAGTGIGTYSGGRTAQGRTTPTGNMNAFNFPGGLEAFKKAWSPFVDLSKFKTVQEAQAATYDYLVKNQPEVAASIWQSQGLTAKGKKLIASDPKFAAIVNQVFDKTGKLKEGVNLTPEQLSALTPAYADNMLGIRAITPSVASKTTTEEIPVEEQPPVKKQVTPLNPNVTLNPNFVKHPNNEFYEPTYWSDIAAPFAGLVDSFRRWPELYNPMEFNQLRYKLLDPTAALNANQADFNAAVDVTDEFGNSGAASANKANMLGQKYRANNQVMSQYDNQNTQIKNNEITYNTQVRDKQSVADAQSREKFYTNVLLGREAQRQQFLTSLSQLARADQLKRRQNTSGNLLLKLSPAFDQFGEYNGYQYLPYLDPAVVNYNDQTVQPAKVSSKNTKTQNVTTWKDASGRVHKTTTTE